MQPRDYKELKGRCLSCGYLSEWERTGRIFHIGMSDRLHGRAFTHTFPTGEEISVLPFCFRNVVAFESSDEAIYKEGQSPQEKEEAADAAFGRDRHCSLWHPYREGLTPQAHLEEQRAFELEKRREAFEQKMEQERRDFELELANRLEQSEERRHSMMRWVALVGAALVLVEILAVVLGAGPGSLLGDWLSR